MNLRVLTTTVESLMVVICMITKYFLLLLVLYAGKVSDGVVALLLLSAGCGARFRLLLVR